MSLLNEFRRNIQEQQLFQKNDYLLLAVSGGADSVALCELCFQAGFHFEMAHCNFQLRGEESERDEKFVRQLAEKYWTKIFVKKFDTIQYAGANKVSTQVAARELRYKWFDELLKERTNLSNQEAASAETLSPFTIPNSPFPIHHSPFSTHHLPFILTAHHANDNMETLLMNFFKGSGIKGLQGIPMKNGKIIRPLLFAKKEEILSFIAENNLEYVEDSSNASEKYTRNFIRNQLIPSIQKVYPKVEDNLIGNLERLKEAGILYQQSIQNHKSKLLEQKGNEIHIPVLKLLKTVPLKTIVYEIIKDFGFTPHQAGEVINLLHSESGKYISSATHKIIRNRQWLIISPTNNLLSHHILIDEADITSGNFKVNFELGNLKFKTIPNDNKNISGSNDTAKLDFKNISFPLILRKWKQGDYFYPLGMQGKKKLSRFFIDQKMSIVEKEKIWVIESDKKILWIIGQRIDDRFKITGKTKNVLMIQFNRL